MSILSQFKQSQNTDFPNVRPSLDLRFALTKKLDPRITFTRGSTGTYFGSDGIMRTAGVNEPRFDHDPVTGQSLGLLIEESRSNLVAYSEDFNQGIWTKVGVTISANSTTSPTGELTADTLVENTSTGTHRCVIAPTIANTTVYTVSVYAKQAGRTNFRLSLGSGLTGEVIVNLSNGIVASSTGATNIIIQNVGNGWYRISFTAAASTGTTGQVQVQLVQGTITTSYSGDGTSGIYVWGAQLEAGALPTSYIPTTASTVTRSADNASMTGRNFSSWYNSREGTIQTNIAIPYRAVGGARSFALDNGTVAYMLDFTNTSTVVGLEGLENSGYRSIAFISNSTSIKLNQTTTYSTQPAPSQIICVNGTLNPTGKTYLTTSNYANLRLGTQVNGAGYLNGTISRLTYYPIQLTNQQLINLTS